VTAAEDIVAPAETLNSFRDMVASFPMLSTIAQLHRVRFVVDANVVLSDLRWLARRKNPEARTILQEVLAGGTVIAFAPPQLDAEVTRHLPRIAKKAKVAVEVLEAEWLAYRAQFRFRAPAEGERPAHVQDPDDLPYLYLRAEIGAEAIYTNDSDLVAMGAPVVGAEIVIALRDYTRASSIDVSIKMGGTVVAVASGAVLMKIWEGVKTLFAAVGQLPAWMKWLLAGVAVAAVLHPRSRALLQQAAQWVPDRTGAALKVLMPLVLQAAVTADRHRKLSSAALERVDAALPRPGTLPAWAHALRICREEGRPLGTEVIAERVLHDGYVTRSQDFTGYIRKVLREREEFVEDSSGAWSIAPGAVREPGRSPADAPEWITSNGTEGTIRTP
jgi:predicted nucleic acid-binding protein